MLDLNFRLSPRASIFWLWIKDAILLLIMAAGLLALLAVVTIVLQSLGITAE